MKIEEFYVPAKHTFTLELSERELQILCAALGKAKYDDVMRELRESKVVDYSSNISDTLYTMYNTVAEKLGW